MSRPARQSGGGEGLRRQGLRGWACGRACGWACGQAYGPAACGCGLPPAAAAPGKNLTNNSAKMAL